MTDSFNARQLANLKKKIEGLKKQQEKELEEFKEKQKYERLELYAYKAYYEKELKKEEK